MLCGGKARSIFAIKIKQEVKVFIITTKIGFVPSHLRKILEGGILHGLRRGLDRLKVEEKAFLASV